tara:strand:+ start:28704 stop:29366 length:663 start_codon:yes stop_codon:yes gene_type:complete
MNWSKYRLADTLWRKGIGMEYHLREYPDSVCSEYIRRRKVLPRDVVFPLMSKADLDDTFDVLREIVIEKFGAVQKNNLTCIQVRTGDVIDYCKNHTVDDHLNNRITTDTCGIWDWAKPCHEYVKPIPYYESKLGEINYDKIVIAGGGCSLSPRRGEESRSSEYMRKMADHFDAEIVDLNPDEMLHFSMCCENLIGAGGAGKMIGSYYAEVLRHLRDDAKE